MVNRGNNEYIFEEYSGLSEFERKSVMLVETCGVASYDVQGVIYQIVSYVNDEINKVYNTFQYTPIRYKNRKGVKIIQQSTEQLIINIPKDITKQFTNFENLEVIVKITDLKGNINPKDHICSSEGVNSVKSKGEIKNDKLVYSKITISCSSINGKLIVPDFYDAFNHEYNHAYEEFKRVKNKENNPKIKTGLEINNHINSNLRRGLLLSKNDTERAFGDILYTLWTKKEFNAWVTSTYSYLKGVESDRYSFLEDLKKTDAYKKYINIKNVYLPLIKQCNNGDLWIYVHNIITKDKIIPSGNKHGILHKLNVFKERFIRKTENQLNKFWVQMCKTASLYYNEKEFN